MKSKAYKAERLYSLDSLRAILMLLGVIFHTTLTYRASLHSINIDAWMQDPISTHILNDYITDFVHAFRMQHFYLIAGFFGAMLFYSKGPLQSITNRFLRVGLPFAVFIVILSPLCNFAFDYSRLVFSGGTTAFASTLSDFSFPGDLIPGSTKHLWFLYYLIFFSAFSISLGLVFRKLPSLSNRISNTFSWLIQQTKYRVLILSGITFLIYSLIEPKAIENSFYKWIPDISVFIFYLSFYLVGWLLFKSKHLLKTMMQSDWLCLMLGLVLFTVHFVMKESVNEMITLMLIIKSLTTWLFIFGITGLFIRYGSNQSARMRYISDSSYWVYLLHLPLTAFLPGFIADWQLHAILKLLIVVVGTMVICLATYHYLVRGTFIGQFLNGKKYSKKTEGLFTTKPIVNNS